MKEDKYQDLNPATGIFGAAWIGIIILLLLLAGCATITTERVALEASPQSCQVSEVRPSMLSTLVVGVCWDKDGEVIGMTGASGTPSAQIPLTAAQVGAIVVGGALIGRGLKDASNISVGVHP